MSKIHLYLFHDRRELSHSPPDPQGYLAHRTKFQPIQNGLAGGQAASERRGNTLEYFEDFYL